MKKLYGFFAVAALALGVFSCAKDDEPQDYQPTYDGVSVYINAIDQLYDSDGQPAFTATDREGVYVGSASSYQVSYNFITDILENKDWDGKDVTVKLGENGENGTLKVVGETDALLQKGIYNEIIIDIKDYTPYTLEIITEEAADNGYIGGGVVIKKVGGDA